MIRLNQHFYAKKKITEAVLAEIKELELYPINSMRFEGLMSKWWRTGRQGGLRLSELGAAAFKAAQIEYFDYSFTVPAGMEYYTFLSNISKKIPCPYYIGARNETRAEKYQPYIRIYDSKVAMLISLYGSNLQEYLESITV